MRTLKLHSLIGAIFFAGSGLWLRADPPAAITDLEAKIRKACEQQDLSAIKACYDFTGASSERIDIDLSGWQAYWNQSEKTHWKFAAIDFATLDQLHADKTMSWQNLQSMIQPQKMGEHVYAQTLPAIGFITVHFKDEKGGSVGTMEPVGMESDGTAKIASLRIAP